MQEAWNNACETAKIPQSIADKWFNQIWDAHRTSDKRLYHTTKVLQSKFDLLQSCRPARPAEWLPLVFAISFQYYVYDARQDCGEQNIAKVREFFADAKVENPALLASIEHLLGNESASAAAVDLSIETIQLFGDLDLAIMSAKDDDYKNYTEQLLAEYGYEDAAHFKSTRLKLLQMFISIPNIYSTEVFQQRFESAARANIRTEIEELKRN